VRSFIREYRLTPELYEEIRAQDLARQPYTTKLPRNPAANAHMFFKRLLTIWFLLFTLNSSVAWAFSDHLAGEYDGSEASDSGTGHPAPVQDRNTCDDHCGHSSAHVVALIFTSTGLALVTESAAVHISQQIPDSRKPAPPFQPPIA